MLDLDSVLGKAREQSPLPVLGGKADIADDQIVGWAERSEPTMVRHDLHGGHGAKGHFARPTAALINELRAEIRSRMATG
jgi:hypothetical protein